MSRRFYDSRGIEIKKFHRVKLSGFTSALGGTPGRMLHSTGTVVNFGRSKVLVAVDNEREVKVDPKGLVVL